MAESERTATAITVQVNKDEVPGDDDNNYPSKATASTAMTPDFIPKSNGKLMRFPISSSGQAIGRLHKSKRPTQCIGLIFLREQPDVAAIREVLLTRLLKIPKMRCRLYLKNWWRNSYWEETDVNVADHFQVLFPDRDDVKIEEIHEYLSEQHNDLMDITKPLWRITFVPHLADGRSLIISNISHAIGDGIAQVDLLFRLLDDQDSAVVEDLTRTPSEAEEQNAKAFAKRDMKIQKRKKSARVSTWDRVRMFGYGIVEGSLRSFLPRDPMSTMRLKDPLNGTSLGKKMCEARPIDLDRVKAIKKKFANATVNDVLIAVLTLSVKAALKEVNDKRIKSNKISAQFPINMRKRGTDAFQNGNPYNNFSYGKFFLPFASTSRIDTVRRCKRQADLQKVCPSPYMLTFTLAAALKLLPKAVAVRQGKKLATQSTITISNVPGPQKLVNIGGVAVDELSFYLFSIIGAYYGVMSYNGQVRLSVNLDKKIPFDPQHLCDLWNEEFDALEADVANLPDASQ